LHKLINTITTIYILRVLTVSVSSFFYQFHSLRTVENKDFGVDDLSLGDFNKAPNAIGGKPGFCFVKLEENKRIWVM